MKNLKALQLISLIILCVLFFFVFSTIGESLHTLFFLKDSKQTLLSSELFGDLIFVTEVPSENYIPSATSQAPSLEVQSLLILDGWESLAKALEALPYVKNVLPRTSRIENNLYSVRVYNDLYDRTNSFGILSNFVIYDFSRAYEFFLETNLFSFPNVAQGTILLSQPLVDRATEAFYEHYGIERSLAIYDIIELSSSSGSVRLPFSAVYSINTTMSGSFAENTNLGFTAIIDISGYQKMFKRIATSYETIYIAPPSSLNDVTFPNFGFINGNPETSAFTRPQGTLGITQISIRLQPGTDIIKARTEILKLAETYLVYKPGAVHSLMEPEDFAYTITQRAMYKEEGFSNLVIGIILLICSCALSIFGLNLFFQEQTQKFSLYTILGARKWKITRSIILQSTLIVGGSGGLGLAFGIYRFMQSESSALYVSSSILSDIIITGIALLLLVSTFCSVYSTIRMRRLNLIKATGQEKV